MALGGIEASGTFGIGSSSEDGSSEERITGDLLESRHPLRSALFRIRSIFSRVADRVSRLRPANPFYFIGFR